MPNPMQDLVDAMAEFESAANAIWRNFAVSAFLPYVQNRKPPRRPNQTALPAPIIPACPCSRHDSDDSRRVFVDLGVPERPDYARDLYGLSLQALDQLKEGRYGELRQTLELARRRHRLFAQSRLEPAGRLLRSRLD